MGVPISAFLECYWTACRSPKPYGLGSSPAPASILIEDFEMKVFRLVVSDKRLGKNTSKSLLAHYGKNWDEVMVEFSTNHPYLKVHSIKEVYNGY